MLRSILTPRCPVLFTRRMSVVRLYSQNATSERLQRLSQRIPPGTWDTHMHVVDPRVFPLDKAAKYQPKPHTMEQAKALLSDQLGIHKMVIVQPSIYGNDNACTLAGLRELSSRNGRAVIQFDPHTTTPAQLQEWHALGVRGVRLNFKSIGVSPSAADLTAALSAYAAAVRPLGGWFLQVYIGLEQAPLLERAAAAAGVGTGDADAVPLCLDHAGHPTAEALAAARAATELPGWDAFARLLARGGTWVKLSAGYRLSREAAHPVVESLFREILRRRPDRCVFATDWPHTRFDDVEVGVYLEKVLDWCEAEGVKLEQVLVKNADKLLDAQG